MGSELTDWRPPNSSLPRSRRRHQHGCHFTVASINLASLASSQHSSPQGSSSNSTAADSSPQPASGIQTALHALSNLQQHSPFQLPFTQDSGGGQGQKQQATDSKTQLHWASPPWLRKRDGQQQAGSKGNSLRHTPVPDESGPALICLEVTNGRKRTYRQKSSSPEQGSAGEAWDMVEAANTAKGHMLGLLRSYLLPQGFPESVAPQYASYMGWRGIQYFFGGAISVYTTKSLLGALGVAGRFSGEASAAINWVIKDGAGRLGRLLFARWGRELDCELKQFRLFGDLLMEGGAALELATIWAPKAFLPLACTANLAKNLAAVAASSTRAPIYRTFALQNNLADITAKGESVANLADILGTVAGILISRVQGLPMFPTFCVLSLGYLIASRKEVDSVELPYLNRARLGYCQRAFLATGAMPGVAEANHSEPLLPGQGFNNGRIVLGSTLEAACHTPSDLKTVLTSNPHGQKYLLTYRPDQKKVHVLLKEGANSQDCLRASFAAHLMLYIMEGHVINSQLPSCHNQHTVGPPATLSWQTALSRTTKLMDALYPEFVKQAEKQGWKLSQTMLNPKETRILKIATPL